jgi:hypothetical protein
MVKKTEQKQKSSLNDDPIPTEVSRDKRWGDVNVPVKQMRKIKEMIKKGVLTVKK